MVEEGKEIYNIYKIDTNRKLNVKKVILVVLLIICAIGLILVAKNSIQIIKQHKVYEQYEAQVIFLQKQEEEKQAKIKEKEEKAKQEKLPKLTDGRKEEY